MCTLPQTSVPGGIHDGRTELDEQATGPQSITVEDSMSMVHASRGFLKPPSGEARSEPWIRASLARATLGSRVPVDSERLAGDYALIRDKIEAVHPNFKAFNDRIRTPRGLPASQFSAAKDLEDRPGRRIFCSSIIARKISRRAWAVRPRCRCTEFDCGRTHQRHILHIRW